MRASSPARADSRMTGTSRSRGVGAQRARAGRSRRGRGIITSVRTRSGGCAARRRERRVAVGHRLDVVVRREQPARRSRACRRCRRRPGRARRRSRRAPVGGRQRRAAISGDVADAPSPVGQPAQRLLDEGAGVARAGRSRASAHDPLGRQVRACRAGCATVNVVPRPELARRRRSRRRAACTSSCTSARPMPRALVRAALRRPRRGGSARTGAAARPAGCRCRCRATSSTARAVRRRAAAPRSRPRR